MQCFRSPSFWFVTLLLALLLGLAAFQFCPVSRSFKAPSQLENTSAQPAFAPEVPEIPPLLLSTESTGELRRKPKYDAKTGQISEIEVGYKDGRQGVYLFQGGKLKSYSAYDQKGNLFFQGQYENGARLFSYRVFDSDGKLKTQFQRLPDGSEQVLFFNKNGFCIGSCVTARDGSQVRSSRPSADKPAEITATAAKAEQKQLLKIQLADGSDQYRLKVQLAGVRILSWQYLSAEGRIMHTGKFVDDESIEITLHDPAGNPAVQQTWKLQGEDWSGKIYKLAELKKLSSSGSIESSILLWHDGQTPKEISNYYWGHKNTTQLCDRQGKIYRHEYYDSNGSPTSGYDVPAQYRQVMRVHPSLLAEPSENGKSLLRLNGNAYGGKMPEGESGFFLLPGEKD